MGKKYCLFFTKYQLKVFFFQRVSCTHEQRADVKALVNEDTLLRTHYCPWCFLGCANWETFVADTKCFWTKSETFFVSRTQNWCPQQTLRVRANGETFVSATMCLRLPGPLEAGRITNQNNLQPARPTKRANVNSRANNKWISKIARPQSPQKGKH